jgi:hypothetical protein
MRWLRARIVRELGRGPATCPQLQARIGHPDHGAVHRALRRSEAAGLVTRDHRWRTWPGDGGGSSGHVWLLTPLGREQGISAGLIPRDWRTA